MTVAAVTFADVNADEREELRAAVDAARRKQTGRPPLRVEESWFTRPLTPAELHVLNRLSEGLTDSDIAIESGWSLYTVKDIKQRVLRKLGARNAPHAVRRAFETGVL